MELFRDQAGERFEVQSARPVNASLKFVENQRSEIDGWRRLIG
jgi:hypothetical protein